MSTWANSGLAHAALSGAMLALGRTTPPVAAPDAVRSRRCVPVEPNSPAAFDERELAEPRWPGRALPETSPGRYREEPGAGLLYPTSPTRRDAGVVGPGGVGGSTRPVNPTDGFLAGSVTALAAAPLPVWDVDGAAIGAWSDSGTLAVVPVVPAPPLSGPSPSDSSSLSELSPLGSFPSAGLSAEGSGSFGSGGFGSGGFASLDLGGEPPGSDAVPSSSEQPRHGARPSDLGAEVEQVEQVEPAADSSALGSLDNSGLFVALSRLPTSCR